jgi:parallel beta-helix repeat protein
MRAVVPGKHAGKRFGWATARRYRRARVVQFISVAAAAALLAAGLSIGLRTISQNGVLDASRTSSGPLFGASASTHGELSRNTQKFGRLGIIRTTYNGLPPANAWGSGPPGSAKSAVIVSFQARPSAIIAGTDNASLAHFFDTAPKGHPIYWAYYSEPELSVGAHKFTAAQYRTALAEVAALARAAHNSDLKATLIVRARDLFRGSTVNWKSYLPSGHVIKTVAWDAYPTGTQAGVDPTLTGPAKFMGPAAAASKAAGLSFGFAGFALATATGRPDWLYSVADYLMSSHALFGVLTTLPSVPATDINDQASIAAWKAVVARSGTDDPFPPGGTSPSPSASASGTGSPSSSASPSPTPTTSLSPPPASATLVCGQPILNSPYDYDTAVSAITSYRSGTAGLPTFGQAGTDFPADTAGAIVPTNTSGYADFGELNPDTVYYLLPGTHIGSFQALTGDAFVGGLAAGQGTVLSGNYSQNEGWAIDSNETLGNQTGVTIEYLTIEKYTPGQNGAAINQDTNTGWTIQDNTVTLNVPGAGIMAGTDNVIKDNCLTLNGQYGFQSDLVNSWGADSLTGGPYDITVENNEISYNDTCDYEGLIDNSAIGWSNYNPVPAADQNSECGSVTPDGDEGGFKLWQTDGVTIKDNYIHNNWGPGAWVDTGNANTTFTGNTFTDNEGEAIFEEISYNFSITSNYMADNDWIDGLGNNSFPMPAIYISNAGSDTTLGAVPACPEASCSGQGAYPDQSLIEDNTLVDNGGNVFLWEDSNRNCTDGYDGECTLVDGGQSSPFTISSCDKNLPSATVNATNHVGNATGSPAEDYWDGCQWETANVLIKGNTIDFNPADFVMTIGGKSVNVCNQTDWPDCGGGGIFSEYGSPSTKEPDWAVATQLTFYQNDVWEDNTYSGPSVIYAWNQGNLATISWADWTGALSGGDSCGSAQEEQSGTCTGPFGQDAGSTYDATPSASP